MPDLIIQIAQANEWWYFGKANSFPKSNHIAYHPEGPFACASEVFQSMNLSIVWLSKIFGHKGKLNLDHPDYYALQGCPARRQEKWSELAQRTSKTIHFVETFSTKPNRDLATYYPNGQIVEAKSEE